jgi:hypothetical protein
MAPGGLCLSADPFMQALEFATGKTAIIVGKPLKRSLNLPSVTWDFVPIG